MRIILSLILLTMYFPVMAGECQSVLKNLVSILEEKGDLKEGANIYSSEFSAADFYGSCTVNKYTLHLHNDNSSILVSSKNNKTTILQGPFLSAYKK